MTDFPLNPEPTPLIFERHGEGRHGVPVPEPGDGARDLIPASLRRKTPPRLPEVPEFEVVRHYIELSLKNHHVDRAMYPLGSCTMKYNPKINEDMARAPGFAAGHPLAPDEQIQGSLELIWHLGEILKEIAGLDAITMQPAAGAQGELTGVLVVRAFHKKQGNPRKTVLIPDSAHGTNPATAAIAGYQVKSLKSGPDGQMDLGELERALNEDVACLMITNPSTLGIFERNIGEIAGMVHNVGARLYMDGANMNALMGRVRPGDFGVDVMHYNLHKTFSTPHGGGGPGSGPVAVKADLEEFLPVPVIEREGDHFRRVWDKPDSIGKVHTFLGNFGMHVRAYAYILMLGRKGIRHTADAAVLNANYIAARIEQKYPLPFGRGMHESVFTGAPLKEHGIRTTDVAKRLLDYGFHAPTIYFPLIVPEALMIEPTETATREELDRFCDAMLAIAAEAESNPEMLKGAPHSTPVGRMDEARAARSPDVRYDFNAA